MASFVDSDGNPIAVIDQGGTNLVVLSYGAVDACDPNATSDAVIVTDALSGTEVRGQANQNSLTMNAMAQKASINAEDAFGNSSPVDLTVPIAI